MSNFASYNPKSSFDKDKIAALESQLKNKTERVKVLDETVKLLNKHCDTRDVKISELKFAIRIIVDNWWSGGNGQNENT